jgi:hypothetical protein
MTKHTGNSPFVFLAFILAGVMLVSPAFAAEKPAAEGNAVPKDGVSLSFSFTPQDIIIGKPLTCTIVARWKTPVRVHPFSLPAHLGDFEVLRTTSSQIKAGRKDGTQTQVFGIQLTCFEAGEKTLPPIELQYSVGEGELKTAATAPQVIQVKSYLEKLALEKKPGEQVGLRGVKPPLEMPFPFRRLLSIAGVVLCALALMAVAIWLLRKWILPPVRRETPAPPPLPPDVEALQALARLELEDAARREAVKPYYSKLSEILRRYLGRRYTFDALEMTSSELFERARGLGWNRELLAALAQDTQESDGVKFARYVPAHPLRTSALERVRKVVMETRIVQTPDTPAPAQEGGAKG